MNDEMKEIEIWKEKTKGIFHITEYRRFWNNISSLHHENKILKENNEKMQELMCRTWEKTSNLISSIYNDKLHYYRVMSDLEEILKDRETSYVETYDKLDEYIKKELEKYE